MRMSIWRLKFQAIASMLLITAFSSPIQAQLPNPYNYEALSHWSNLKLKDSLKKAWTAPLIYKERETQKKFKELWDSRTAFLISAIENKNYIAENEVFLYLDNILNQLQQGNKHLIPQKPILLIDRSGSVNAYSMGSNVIAVNLGLVAFASSREEIALVLAHELSHDILKHAEKSMRERAEWLTSPDYKKSINEVLDSKYERYSRLKKIMEGYTFNRSKHNRYGEGEADSLAVLLLKNSRIPFDASYFLRLDSADTRFKQPLNKPIKEYFTAFGLPFEDSWSRKVSKGLSSRNYNFQKSNELADSLKTHPDCQERFERTKDQTTVAFSATPLPASLVNKINKMIIWNVFDNRQLTACLYRIFQEYDKGNHDEWYDLMLFSVFSGLTYADQQLERFNYINVLPKELIAQPYYELQTTLEQIPKESLEYFPKKLGALPFWQQLPADARVLRGLFLSILQKEETAKNRSLSAKAFKTAHNNSMYAEFADHFIQ